MQNAAGTGGAMPMLSMRVVAECAELKNLQNLRAPRLRVAAQLDPAKIRCRQRFDRRICSHEHENIF